MGIRLSMDSDLREQLEAELDPAEFRRLPLRAQLEALRPFVQRQLRRDQERSLSSARQSR